MTQDQTATEAHGEPTSVGRGVRERPKLVSPGCSVGIALTLITVMLLGIAGAIGLLPDAVREVSRERAALLETVAIAASRSVTSGDEQALGPLAEDLLQRTPHLRSAAVCKANGTAVFESAGHPARWAGAPATGSTLTHARVPVFDGATPWGRIELSFNESHPTQVLGVALPPEATGLVFTSLGAFLAYWACAHVVLGRLAARARAPQRVQSVLDAMTEAVVLLDNRERIVVANAAFWLLTGRAPGDLVGRTPSCLSWHHDTPAAGPETFPWRETLADGAPRTRQRLTFIDESGSIRILSAGTAAIAGPDGRCRGVLLTLDDITITEELNAEHAGLVAQLARSREELHRKNEELQILATTDLLTGGLTRRALFEQFRRLWSHAKRYRAPLACIMIDVDHFKTVNDKHGHAAGDQVLRDVGLRLREAVRTEDIVGRYGGEEFCIIAPDTPIAGAAVLAERIRESIQSAPCAGLSVTVSLGIAVMNAGTPDFEALIASADNGLYAAKRSGRNRVAVGTLPDISRAA